MVPTLSLIHIWIEGALDHALAVHFEDLRAGEAAHQRLTYLGRVGAVPGGEQQGFGHRLDVQRDDDLVGHLGGLAVTIAADAGDVLAHGLEPVSYTHLLQGEPPEDYNLLPGMAMRVSLQRPAQSQTEEEGFRLPLSALQTGSDGKHFIWQADEGRARRLAVQLQQVEGCLLYTSRCV